MIGRTSATQAADGANGVGVRSSRAEGRPETLTPAKTATARVFAVGLLLGLVGLASAVFVITRLFESWRVTSGPASRVITVLGLRLSYPAANAGAIAVTGLAGLGLLMAAAAACRLVMELVADRRFKRVLRARSPRSFRGAWLIDDKQPQAFCTGLLRPRIFVSTGTLEVLDTSALASVLAHEQHHARRWDPLRLASGRVLAAALFFIPAYRHLLQHQHTLAEISADEAAVVSSGGDRSALASAMLSFSRAGDDGDGGVDPARVDYLLGEQSAWRFPALLCLGIGAALALFVGVAVLAAHAASGSATLAPPFLSSQPCIAVLAMIPTAAGLAGTGYLRARRASRALQLMH